MTAGIPPDGYLKGCRQFAPHIAEIAGVPVEAIGDYVIMVWIHDCGQGADVILSPGLPIAGLPAGLRDLADSLDQRARRLLS